MQLRTAVVVLVGLAIMAAIIVMSVHSPKEGHEHEGEATPEPSGPPAPVDLAQLDQKHLAEVPPAAREILAKNHFVLVDNPKVQRFGDVYDECQRQSFPPFITVDVCVYALFRVANWYHRLLEAAVLRDDLGLLTDLLSKQLEAYRAQANDEQTKQAALDALAFISVGARLLGRPQAVSLPPDVAAKVGQEVELIRGAAGEAESPVLGRRLDYRGFAPFGHYAGAEALGSYYRALTWFGEAVLTLEDEKSPERANLSVREVLLLCKALHEAETEVEPAHYIWRRIYETEGLFLGPSDALSPERCWELAQKAFGGIPSLEALGDASKLSGFASRAAEAERTEVPAGLIPAGGTPRTPRGMSFLGRRISPDASILQELLLDAVGPYQGAESPFTVADVDGLRKRAFPRGLDLAAALGLQQAEGILRHDGDADYMNFEKQLAGLKAELDGLPRERWKESLPMAALTCGHRLVQLPPAPGAGFQRVEGWNCEQMTTALAAWAELRHRFSRPPNVAYTSTSAPVAAREIVPAPNPLPAYVDPAQSLYRLLSEFLGLLSNDLSRLGYTTDPALQRANTDLRSLLSKLETASEVELSPEAPSDEHEKEHAQIPDFGTQLNNILAGCRYDRFQMPLHSPDELLPSVIADAHIEEHTGQVLEVGLGRPLVIYIVCPIEKKPTLCKGAVYSYYEFKRPLAERLTDEAWRNLLASDRAPARPSWITEYVVQSQM